MSSDIPGVDTTVDDGVLRVTLDRPARMNAVTTETLDVVADAFDKHAGDAEVRAAVLTGAGRAFCTGADLGGENVSGPPSSATNDAANRTAATIRAFPRPVIGAVNGPAAVRFAASIVADDGGPETFSPPRSAPVQNARPVPVRTAARTSASPSTVPPA